MIKRFVELLGFDFEREPSVITTGQMVSLRAGFATLTLFSASQLFEPSVQFFDLPAQVVRVLSDLSSQSLIWAIGNDPVNVAVWGDQLEQPYLKRNFFQLDQDAVL